MYSYIDYLSIYQSLTTHNNNNYDNNNHNTIHKNIDLMTVQITSNPPAPLPITSNTTNTSNIVNVGHGIEITNFAMWRHDLGFVLLIISYIVMFISIYIIYKRSHIPPLNSRSKILNYVLSISIGFSSITPIIEFMGENICQCNAYYFIYSTYLTWVVGPRLLNSWRLLRMYGFDELKKQYKYGKVRLTQEQTDQLRNYQKYHSEKFLFSIQILQTTLFTIIFVGIFLTDNYYNRNQFGCRWGMKKIYYIHIHIYIIILSYIYIYVSYIKLTL